MAGSKTRKPKATSSPSSTRKRPAPPPPPPPENLGDRAIRFINRLTLCDDFDGQPFVTRDWQDKIIRELLGTLLPDGRRRYRKCLLMLPRKQAKTQLIAAIAVYLLIGTGRSGEQIVCAAADREQAANLFDKCVSMIEANPHLAKRVRIYTSSKRRIVTKKGGNVLKVVSADGRRQHGLNPSVVIIDELHCQPNRDLYAALTTAQGTRSEPLILMISTAGNDRDSLCYERYSYAKRVAADPARDPTFLPILYEAAEDDDWTAEATWLKAMPALGDFCSLEFIRSEFREALESSSKESEFRQLYLNQWVASAAKWVNRAAWDSCGLVDWDPDELLGRECYAGLDLSNTNDVTAFVLVFPMDDGTFRVLCWFWLPRARAEARDKASFGELSFVKLAEEGFVILTDGDVIDHDAIKKTILGDPEAGTPGIVDLYRVAMTRIDQFSASQIAIQLQNAGMNVEFMRQGVLSMNEPVRTLEVLLSRGLMLHGDNPILNWMADNAVRVTDPEGLVRLSKGKSADKIDGVISLVMGLAAAVAVRPELAPSCTTVDLDPAPEGSATPFDPDLF
ncbi:MAG: terminase large subunit [Parafilimonas terrae]|nr:terminase large subunit [Parafilimonas terrae]